MQRIPHLIGVDEIAAMHGAIVDSARRDGAEPCVHARCDVVDDCSGLLGGVREAAPPEAFEAVIGLARSVLRPTDHAALTDRPGVAP